MQSTDVYLSWREVPCIQNGYIVRYYATCGSERNVQQSKSVVEYHCVQVYSWAEGPITEVMERKRHFYMFVLRLMHGTVVYLLVGYCVFIVHSVYILSSGITTI